MADVTFASCRTLAVMITGESYHLAKPSGALYTSDLQVSTCSKYNPWLLWMSPEHSEFQREKQREESVRERDHKRETFSF